MPKDHPPIAQCQRNSVSRNGYLLAAMVSPGDLLAAVVRSQRLPPITARARPKSPLKGAHKTRHLFEARVVSNFLNPHLGRPQQIGSPVHTPVREKCIQADSFFCLEQMRQPRPAQIHQRRQILDPRKGIALDPIHHHSDPRIALRLPLMATHPPRFRSLRFAWAGAAGLISFEQPGARLPFTSLQKHPSGCGP